MKVKLQGSDEVREMEPSMNFRGLRIESVSLDNVDVTKIVNMPEADRRYLFLMLGTYMRPERVLKGVVGK